MQLDSVKIDLIDKMISEAFDSCAMETPEVANAILVMISVICGYNMD